MGEKRQCVAGNGTEDGFLLLAVVVMAAIILIALSVAAPIVAYQLRRDKEVESEHRAEQYVRAIQLYYRKNQGYPPSIKALGNTNNVRYLRQEYVDPLTGKSDWRLIHQGEQKTTIKGFFGQELTGLGGAGGGLGAAAGMQSNPGSGATIGGSSTISAGGLAGGFNGATTGDTSGGPGGAGTAGANGTSTGTGSNGTPGSNGGSGSSSTSGAGMFGDSGGGGPIVGVGTSKTGNSILTPNQQTTYETWEFWYDPRIELMKRNVSITGGGMSSQPASSAMGSGATPGSTGTSNTPGTPGSSTDSSSPFGSGSSGSNGSNGSPGSGSPSGSGGSSIFGGSSGSGSTF